MSQFKAVKQEEFLLTHERISLLCFIEAQVLEELQPFRDGDLLYLIYQLEC